ncbi:hypothetical protein [Methylomonas sp. AM2-LC]|uniref:hypothetical protein n=1 Tax=Methylomonas sp. AM2-LC TaxID=3153301 RepID=UPI00326685CF
MKNITLIAIGFVTFGTANATPFIEYQGVISYSSISGLSGQSYTETFSWNANEAYTYTVPGQSTTAYLGPAYYTDQGVPAGAETVVFTTAGYSTTFTADYSVYNAIHINPNYANKIESGITDTFGNTATAYLQDDSSSQPLLQKLDFTASGTYAPKNHILGAMYLSLNDGLTILDGTTISGSVSSVSLNSSPVPEAEEWVLMMLGLTMVGWVTRRKNI